MDRVRVKVRVGRVGVGGVFHHAKLSNPRVGAVHGLLKRGGEGWSGECGRGVPSRQIVKPARRRRTRVAEAEVRGACPFVHECVCAD